MNFSFAIFQLFFFCSFAQHIVPWIWTFSRRCKPNNALFVKTDSNRCVLFISFSNVVKMILFLNTNAWTHEIAMMESQFRLSYGCTVQSGKTIRTSRREKTVKTSFTQWKVVFMNILFLFFFFVATKWFFMLQKHNHVDMCIDAKRIGLACLHYLYSQRVFANKISLLPFIFFSHVKLSHVLCAQVNFCSFRLRFARFSTPQHIIYV